MLKTVAAIAGVAAIPMLFAGSPSAVAKGATDADRAAALSAAPRPQAPTPIRRPIAYGHINSDGTVASGSGNFTSVFDPVNHRYAIKITGVKYFFTNFSTIVTPDLVVDPAPTCGISSLSGKLLIACYDTAGARIQVSFGFGVF